ncbi:NAD-dependent epimerase/dehydratase family protein [Actinoplanes sp. G11-F43]|uniref:NAD-dependent epimerase/dehydratase family protein n=1 Tax=Actinoplanes sp. G11-F43 TaxID=3424130 RepID=UPI003D350C87
MTGADGRIGRMLRTRLSGHDLRLSDLRGGDGVDRLDVTDGAAVERAARGADAILHLGGIAGEDSFESLLTANVRGTEQVLAAAYRAGVPRVILASSNHAAGMYRREPDLPDDVPARPDSYYGWSKAAMEALGRLHHDRHGTHVVCLRIGRCADRPATVRDLSVWLSPDDMARLVEASLTATGHRLVWGVSANTRRWWSDAGGRAIGFHPADDAEKWAAEVTDDGSEERVGGDMTGPENPLPGDGRT